MKNVVLAAIFLLALFLRLWQLDRLPWGFYEEEVTNAYVGRFILQNGRDLHGNWLPLLYFDKFGDFPPVLPMYLAGLSTYLFGLTELAARFPTALVGALTVLPLYFLAQLVFKDKRGGLLAALLLAIAPWHIVLSRTSSEGIIGLALYTWGVWWLLAGINEADKRRVLGAVGLFLFSYFIYPGLRLIVPLTLLPLPILTKNIKFKRLIILATLAAFLLTAAVAATPWGKGRFVQTSLFHSQEVAARIGANLEALSYGEGQNNIALARLFHNKIVGYTREFVSQYVSYFSPQHLLVAAGGQPRYFNVPYQGLLFITLGVLILAAFLPGPVPPLMIYTVYLLLVTPLPAVLTVDFVPHAHRSLFMLLPFILLATLGFLKLTKLWSKRLPLVLLVIMLTLLAESIYFWHQYSRHEAAYQSVLRNDGDRELAKYIIAHQSEYDKIIMPPFARLPIYYLYFSGNFDPALIGKFGSQLQIESLSGIEFVLESCPTKLLDRAALSPKTLIAENGDCGGTGYRRIELIERRDSTRAWRLVVPQ